MRVEINGEAQVVSSRTLQDLLDEVGFSGRVATAVNEAFVPVGLRQSIDLKEGDRIEILAPMQGG